VIGQLQQGGAEGQLAMLARGLSRTGFEPAVACLSEVAEPHASDLRRDGIPVSVFPRRGRRDLARVRRLAAMLRETGAHLVHSFLVGANAYAYGASRLSGLGRLVVSSRTTMPSPSRSSRWVQSWVFRSDSKVIANSETVKDFTSSYYRVPAGSIRVVRNGVDTSGARRAAGDRAAARAELGVPDGAVLVGTVGRLSREKNLDLFVDLAVALARESSSARFAVVGDGPRRDALARSIREAGLAERVALTGPRSDVPRLLAAMDVFVMTSDTEGLPNAVLEAMAAGLPVVATRVGGVRELVSDGISGHLVPPGQIVPLLTAVRALALDPGLRERHGGAGRERIESEFGVARMVESTAGVYEEVLTK